MAGSNAEGFFAQASMASLFSSAQGFLAKAASGSRSLPASKTPPDARALRRIQRDMEALSTSPPEGIFAVPDDDDVTLSHAIILGPKDTPYEGGIFYFLIRYPPNYPINNPAVLLMTTGNGTVRFNPNLYACGKVCLSILGTWQGPSWTPAYDTQAVLISIQSLMCEEPFYNEPGYEGMKGSKQATAQSTNYNARVKYNSLTVAGLDMFENKNGDTKNMPARLHEITKQQFLNRIEFYKKSVEHYKSLNGTALPRDEMFMSFSKFRTDPKFEYNQLSQRLDAIIKAHVPGPSGDKDDSRNDSKDDRPRKRQRSSGVPKPSTSSSSDQDIITLD